MLTVVVLVVVAAKVVLGAPLAGLDRQGISIRSGATRLAVEYCAAHLHSFRSAMISRRPVRDCQAAAGSALIIRSRDPFGCIQWKGAWK
jgi:hypothetical protein